MLPGSFLSFLSGKSTVGAIRSSPDYCVIVQYDLSSSSLSLLPGVALVPSVPNSVGRLFPVPSLGCFFIFLFPFSSLEEVQNESL